MRTLKIYKILYWIFVLSVFAGCINREEYHTQNQIMNNGLITPYCLIGEHQAHTRSLINQATTTDTILCNFLRIDESGSGIFSSDYAFTTDWRESYVSEGSIATYAQNSQNLRYVSLYPPQPYHSDNKDIKSRMVGWYPRTVDLPENAHEQTVSTQFKNFKSNMIEGTYNEEKYIGVKFTGLNGSTDIMVSDVRDGSFNSPFSSTADPANFFRFKHYLSAVKIFAKAENSSQDIGMWGQIDKVVIMGQPTSCTVLLPQDPTQNDGFAETVLWGDENAKFYITTTPIFGTFDTGNSENISAEEYPINLSGSFIEKYLGYSLIKPGDTFRLQIHMNSGIYEVNINDPDKPFLPGTLYNLHLDFKTDGTIYAFVEHEGEEIYLDLTKGEPYQTDTDGDGDTDGDDATLFKNQYSNCYIVYSNPLGTDQDPEGDATTYDGFCFDATVVGNGEGGIISEGAQFMYPRNAHITPASADILWETSPRLVTQIELIFGFVRFKVAKENDGTFKEGNAVIAVYDENKNILWSWHIWITDKPQDITYQEGSTSITILDRNLGAVFGGTPSNSTEALQTYGLYYQWGRKDPSMGPPEWDYSPINMTTAPYYDYSSEMYNTANMMRFAMPTLKDGVENPMYLIMPTLQTQTYYFNWMYEKMDFLWGYNTITGMTRKTIYDPCPYGYRVSGGELADLFAYATKISTTDSYELSDYGQTVKVPKVDTAPNDKASFFFPYSGFKGVDRGLNSLVTSWRYVGQKGDYQASTVSTYATDQEYFMHRTRIYLSKERTWSELNVGSYTGHQIEDHTNRRTAAPVRCVKNEEHNRVMAFITPDKQTIAQANNEVTLTLYAEAFGTDISSATLSIGYHMKNGDGSEGPHQEYNIEVWQNINTPQWNKTVNFDFDNLYKLDGSGNITSEKIDLSETTGQFRFVLHVKSSDNINKISSTTISLANNNIGFQKWNELDSTIFIGEPAIREVRLYGESRPTKVEMFKVKPDKSEEGPIDITANKVSENTGSSFPYDHFYSTNEVSFSDKGWNYVYFRVTYESGETVTYNTNEHHKKWFKVVGIQLGDELTTAPSDLNANYVIENVNGGYVYDNGTNMSISNTYNYSNFFKFVSSDGGYKICNVQSTDFVVITTSWNSASLNITQDVESAASVFSIGSYNNNGFLISIRPGWTTYYWNKNNNNVRASTNNNNNSRWKIRKVTIDDSGIPANPS